jgi:hypothetical protein
MQNSRSSSTQSSENAKNPNEPGATGKTVVPGNRSTVAGSTAGSEEAKTGQTNTGSSGGGNR